MTQQLREGQTGTAPDGTRVIVRNGQIVPLEAGAAANPVGLAAGQRITGPRGGVRMVGGLNADERKEVSRARTEAELALPVTNDLLRFGRVAGDQGTGGVLAIPFATDVVGAFDPEVAQMNEITARLAPAQRQPGSGTTSDADLRLFLQAVPGANRPAPANQAIIDRGLAEAARRQIRAEFLEDYAAQYGTLTGAAEAWRKAYAPPPVSAGSSEPRANIEPTAAQRAAVSRANASGERNPRAVLGTRQNPRVPPEGFNVNTLPVGDWYIAPNGTLTQVSSRERANQDLRRRSGRGGVVSVRRAD